jgi:intracellular sulfur oxidation DsrE/DsrF family protein
MKKIISSFIVLFFCCLLATAQKDYKVVFDLTSGDSVSQATAIRWATEVAKADPSAEVEIVMFGKGTALAVKDKSAVSDGVAGLANNKNVAFKICAVAMQNQKIDKSQLLPGIQIVPDGIYEIITKQRQGWGYIKVAH